MGCVCEIHHLHLDTRKQTVMKYPHPRSVCVLNADVIRRVGLHFMRLPNWFKQIYVLCYVACVLSLQSRQKGIHLALNGFLLPRNSLWLVCSVQTYKNAVDAWENICLRFTLISIILCSNTYDLDLHSYT